MGNNTSSISNNVKRKSSVSKKKDHLKPTGNINIQKNTIPNTEKGYPPPYKPKAIVSPNIFYENTADADYFSKIDSTIVSSKDSKNSGTTVSNNNGEVLSGGSYEDDYDIDEDLINKNSKNLTHREYTDVKNVLIKFVNYDEQSNEHVEDINQEPDQVYIIGNFNDWSKKIKLHKDPEDKVYKIYIGLPLGIYKVKFLVNSEIKYSEDLPIATDKSGNVVNWFEVDENEQSVFEAGQIEQVKISGNKRKSSISFQNNHATTSQLSISAIQKDDDYTQDIPEIFHQSDEILPVDEEFLGRNPIPELPIYLNNNVLNNHFNKHHNSNLQDVPLKNKNNMISSGLNSHIIPHVNLNHLLTSNIKNNVLSVACTTRYSGKFITQIMYSPSGSE